MNATASLFYFFEALAALSALGVLLARNIFYSALLVITCLLSLAGIYILAFAEFIAVTQILIYAGGILVVIIFGIMLTSRISGKPMEVTHGNRIAGLFIFISVFVFFAINFSTLQITHAPLTTGSAVTPVGMSLMTEFLLPFEAAGVLLLIALIGASITATSTNSRSDVPH